MKKTRLFLPLILILLLSACGAGYQKSGRSYVFVTIDESNGKREHPILGIDPATFEIIEQGGFARDDGQVYYEGRALPGADPASFRALSRLYGADAAQVYYQNKLVAGADPATFELLASQWGRDAGDVYFQERPQQACDPASFELLKDEWQRDRQCAYRNGSKLPGADPASFTVLNYWFAKDARQAYSNLPKVIEGADPATFQLSGGLCQVCARDKNTCYRYEEPVACEQ